MKRRGFVGKALAGVAALFGGGAAMASGGSRMRRGYVQGARRLPAVEPAEFGLTRIEPGDPIVIDVLGPEVRVCGTCAYRDWGNALTPCVHPDHNITPTTCHWDCGDWKSKHPVCPDCRSVMVKTTIECEDGSGWTCGWSCECKAGDDGELAKPDQVEIDNAFASMNARSSDAKS